MNYQPARSSVHGVILFAWYLLRRRPGAELWLYLACQVFAVMVVCGTLLFTDRIEQAIYSENAKLMAAELIIESSRPLSPPELLAWQDRADQLALRAVQTVELDSMVYANGVLQLTEVTAVERGYPLRGQLSASLTLRAPAKVTSELPVHGEIWLDARTAHALAASPGDAVELGASQMVFTRVLHDQPGLVLPSLGLSGRALIAFNQLADTQLLRPGSRATYRWLLAGDTANVLSMSNWLEPRLGPHQQLLSSQQGGERTSEVIERTQGFLNLSGATSLLLALVATLITAYRYLEREQSVVATWKALGFGSRLLSRAYALQFGLWWVGASLLGCLLGVLLQAIAFYALRNWLDVSSAYTWQPFVLAVLTSLVCLLCFAIPILRGLAKVSPIRLLRNSNGASLSPWAMWWLLPAFTLLLYFISRNWSTTLWLVAGLLVLAVGCWLFIGVVVWILQKLLWRYRQRESKPRRGNNSALGRNSAPLFLLGLHAFSRQRRASQVRTTALAMTLAMLVLVVGLRGGLLDAWRAQIPAEAPNFFAVNIAAEDGTAWQQRLNQAGIKSQGLFPVARARLVAINGESVEGLTASDDGARRALGREMVMTQAVQLPLGNIIVQGRWHGATHDQAGAEVSVERDIASRLKLKLGDFLHFSFAGQSVEVKVTSIRALNWNSMQPNFYFILAPPLLEVYPFTYITSFYLPQQSSLSSVSSPQTVEAEQFLFALIDSFPAVALVDIGALIAQLQRVLDRVGLAVQALALLTVAASLLVLVASLRASLDQRLHEQSILRALGGSSSQLRRIAQVELGLSGLVAGLVGGGSGALLVALLGTQLFDMPMLPGMVEMLLILCGSTALVMLAGRVILDPVYRASPLLAWRKG